ncbi:hypothetical protein TRIP_C21537 [Candidatus Zixiibacteriota bacterium]|nr:hypothetical protein TRIP_C21537 [candidate division Zixibacteria bacterium]
MRAKGVIRQDLVAKTQHKERFHKFLLRD